MKYAFLPARNGVANESSAARYLRLATAFTSMAVSILLSACHIETNHDKGQFHVDTRSTPTERTARYSCTHSPETGRCNYVLFTSKCEHTADAKGDHIVETCSFDAFDRFTLQSGESREITTGLPEEFRACMDVKEPPAPGRCTNS